MSNESERPNFDPQSVDVNSLKAEQLETLIHILVSRRLVQGLRDDALGMNPQFIAQVLRYLADNEITGVDQPGSHIDEVRKEYAKRAPFQI